MSELRSKCCGAKVEMLPIYYHYPQSSAVDQTPNISYFCQKCGKQCEIEEKKKPQDTALYASLRR